MKYKLLNSFKLLLVVSFILLAASGCSKDKKKDLPYLKSKSAAELKIPDDLNRPEQNALFEIPPLPEGSKAPDVDPEELEKPPVLVKESEPEEE